MQFMTPLTMRSDCEVFWQKLLLGCVGRLFPRFDKIQPPKEGPHRSLPRTFGEAVPPKLGGPFSGPVAGSSCIFDFG